MKFAKEAILEIRLIMGVSALKEIIQLDWSNFNLFHCLLSRKQRTSYASPVHKKKSENVTVSKMETHILKA